MAAAIGGAIPFFSRDLPDPAKANREELLRWLITKDLAKEPAPTQLALAQRLETEFAAGVDWSEFKNQIDEPQCRATVRKISPAFCVPWILEKADAYGQLAADQQTAFLDRLIDTLEVWQGVEKLLPKQAENVARCGEIAQIGGHFDAGDGKTAKVSLRLLNKNRSINCGWPCKCDGFCEASRRKLNYRRSTVACPRLRGHIAVFSSNSHAHASVGMPP